MDTAACEKKFYVYAHFRESDGSLFYIGKGHGSRVDSKSGRSAHWKNIVRKHGVIKKIIASGLSEEDSYLLEIELIQQARENGLKICNVANGGNGGLSGIKLSQEHIEKLRTAKKGKPQMPDHAAKSRIARKGKRNSKEAIEIVRKARSKPIVNSLGQRFLSAQEAARYISELKGISASQGNISMCASGKRNQAYGLRWRYESEGEIKTARRSRNKKIVEAIGFCCFFSCSDAARYISETFEKKAATQSISHAARTSGNSHGYKWKYVEQANQ